MDVRVGRCCVRVCTYECTRAACVCGLRVERTTKDRLNKRRRRMWTCTLPTCPPSLSPTGAARRRAAAETRQTKRAQVRAEPGHAVAKFVTFAPLQEKESRPELVASLPVSVIKQGSVNHITVDKISKSSKALSAARGFVVTNLLHYLSCTRTGKQWHRNSPLRRERERSGREKNLLLHCSTPRSTHSIDRRLLSSSYPAQLCRSWYVFR